jgi:hypothetical protein
MKNLLWMLAFLMCIPSWAVAQNGDRRIELRAYLFAAPGAIRSDDDGAAAIHLGVGGDLDLYRGLGLEAEIGYVGILELSGLGNGCGSLNGFYEFPRNADARLVPFVTAGHTWFMGSRANAVNFGGGIRYRIGRSVGLKFEFRDHVDVHNGGDQIYEGRVGIALGMPGL